jgi:hypothetical protein
MTRRTALTTVAAAALGTSGARAAAPRTPVLVELFTSEGCSSCPPADLLLQVLDREQPIAEADIIVLSEHVDYWNQIGWTDPFSSPVYTNRQRQYAQQFAIDGIYTPQMVVDGRTQFVGSDYKAAVSAVQSAARVARPTLVLKREAGAFRITTPQPFPVDVAITVALAKEHAVSKVLRGENKGQELAHVAIVSTMLDAGKARRGEPVSVTVRHASDLAGLRAVAFAQETRTGHIAAVCRLTA